MLSIHKEVQYTIWCDECDESDSMIKSDGACKRYDTPSAFFRKIGWRDIQGKTLCPNCAKAFKKEHKNEKVKV